MVITCPRCKVPTEHRSMEHHVRMGKSRNIADKKTTPTPLERVGTWVECEVCRCKHLYNQKGNEHARNETL